MAQFRDAIKPISAFLQGPIGEKLMYTFGLALDLLADKMDAAARMPMPGYGDPSGLPYSAADRSTPRGLTESISSWTLRQKQWLDAARRAGSAQGVLQGVLSYLLAYAPGGRDVSGRSVWNWYNEGDSNYAAAPTYFKGSNWNWDGINDWWVSFLILYAGTNADDSWVAAAPAFGVGTIGNTAISIGLTIPATQVASMRAIVKALKGAHSWYEWIIVSFDPTLFDPTQTAGGGVNPDGTWGEWYKIVSGQYLPSRAANARYCDGAL